MQGSWKAFCLQENCTPLQLCYCCSCGLHLSRPNSRHPGSSCMQLSCVAWSILYPPPRPSRPQCSCHASRHPHDIKVTCTLPGRMHLRAHQPPLGGAGVVALDGVHVLLQVVPACQVDAAPSHSAARAHALELCGCRLQAPTARPVLCGARAAWTRGSSQSPGA